MNKMIANQFRLFDKKQSSNAMYMRSLSSLPQKYKNIKDNFGVTLLNPFTCRMT